MNKTWFTSDGRLRSCHPSATLISSPYMKVSERNSPLQLLSYVLPDLMFIFLEIMHQTLTPSVTYLLPKGPCEYCLPSEPSVFDRCITLCLEQLLRVWLKRSVAGGNHCMCDLTSLLPLKVQFNSTLAHISPTSVYVPSPSASPRRLFFIGLHKTSLVCFT